MNIKDFRDLEVYQLANELAFEIYRLTEKFPGAERYGIIDQLRRAVTSIGANIAEGFGRYHTKEYIKFLYNARGSLMEVLHFLIFSEKLGYVKPDQLTLLEEKIKILGIKLNNLISVLSKQQVARSHNKSQGVTNER